jgi:SAM-dependent methyltransferase
VRDKDEVRQFYDNLWSTFDRGLSRHERDRFAAIVWLLEGLERPNRGILDAGCGLGKLSERLISYGDVTGVDWSETGVNAARERVPGALFFTFDLVRDDITPLAGRFGLAISTEVLEHVGRDNRLRLVRNLYSCLAPQGFLILTTPNREVSEGLPEPGQWHQMEDDLLSVSETLEVVVQAGFRIIGHAPRDPLGGFVEVSLAANAALARPLQTRPDRSLALPHASRSL